MTSQNTSTDKQTLAEQENQRTILRNLSEASEAWEGCRQNIAALEERLIQATPDEAKAKKTQLLAALESFADALEINCQDSMPAEDCPAAQALAVLADFAGRAYEESSQWSSTPGRAGSFSFAFEELREDLKKSLSSALEVSPEIEELVVAGAYEEDKKKIVKEITDKVFVAVNTLLTSPEFGGTPQPQATVIASKVKLAANELIMNTLDHQLVDKDLGFATFVCRIEPEKITLGMINPEPFPDVQQRIAELQTTAASDNLSERGRGLLLVVKSGFTLNPPIAQDDGGEFLSFSLHLNAA
jgi:hypothetical protein